MPFNKKRLKKNSNTEQKSDALSLKSSIKIEKIKNQKTSQASSSKGKFYPSSQDEQDELVESPMSSGKLYPISKSTPRIKNKIQLEEASSSSDSENSITSILSNKSEQTAQNSKFNVKANVNDATHALVYWPEPERMFSVVSIYAIQTKKKIDIGESYQIFFNGMNYTGIIRKIGSKEECNCIMQDIVRCNEKDLSRTNVKTNINKLLAPQISNTKKCLNSELENENIKLKSKIIDLTRAFDNEKIKINELQCKIESLEFKLDQFKQTFNKEEINKILKMCQIFQNIFTGDDGQELLIPLSSKFSDILVSESDQMKINEYLEETCENQGDTYFKKILSVLISDRSIFQSNTACEIKQKYSKKVNAAFCLVKEKDTRFSSKNLTNLINRMIQNSKKNLLKNSVNGETKLDIETD